MMTMLYGNLKMIRKVNNEFIIVEDYNCDNFHISTDDVKEAREIAEKILNVSCYHEEEKVKYPVIAKYNYYLKSNRQYVGWCEIIV